MFLSPAVRLPSLGPWGPPSGPTLKFALRLSRGDATGDWLFPRVLWAMMSCIWEDVVLAAT